MGQARFLSLRMEVFVTTALIFGGRHGRRCARCALNHIEYSGVGGTLANTGRLGRKVCEVFIAGVTSDHTYMLQTRYCDGTRISTQARDSEPTEKLTVHSFQMLSLVLA